MKYELFIAVDSTAEAYALNCDIKDVVEEINENYGPSLIHKEFDSEEKMRGFQDGLGFCAEQCGCGDFYVIWPENEEEREILLSL